LNIVIPLLEKFLLGFLEGISEKIQYFYGQKIELSLKTPELRRINPKNPGFLPLLTN
jgi:hypothetical protein